METKNKFIRKVIIPISIFILLFSFNIKSVFAFNNCTQVGNTSFCDDGTYYNQVGSTIYGSNGTSYSQLGNTTSQDTCPYNSSLDYVTQKCKCNNGYESNGSKCIFKNPYINPPVLSSPTISTTPTTPIKKPIVKTKSNDQICQDSYGISSNWDGTKNDQGGLVCDCVSGYQWNEQKTSCVIDYNLICKNKFGQSHTWNGTINKNGGPNCVEKKSNDQICQDSYGVNSNWDGTKNNKGGLICDCKTGYQWNQEQTQCIITPKVEVKAIAPQTSKVPDVKTIQNEVKEETPNITKPEPINLNQEVTKTTTKVKPKSLWQKIKGLFGF